MCNRYGNRGFGVRHEHFGRNFGSPRDFKVPVNIAKNDNSYELFMFAPDRAKEDFKISLERNVLNVSVEQQTEQSAEEKNYSKREYSYSSFVRSFTLPESADAENIEAAYTAGILKIDIAKREEAKQVRRQIEIK